MEIGTEMTDEEREKIVRDVALTMILDESKKWLSRFRWTITLSVLMALGFVGYGFYLITEVASGSNPALVLLALAVVLGVAGSIRIGKRALKNLQALELSLQTLRELNEIPK